MNNKKIIILLAISIILVIIATFSITYAYLSVSGTQTNANTLNTSCYDIAFSDSDSINITGYPMSSASAFSKLTPYHFTIKNSCEANTQYQVILNVLNTSSTNLLPYINYSLDGATVKKLSSLTPITLPSGMSGTNYLSSYVIDTGSINGINASKSYNLHMWIDESAGNDIMGSTFKAEVAVYNVAG